MYARHSNFCARAFTIAAAGATATIAVAAGVLSGDENADARFSRKPSSAGVFGLRLSAVTRMNAFCVRTRARGGDEQKKTRGNVRRRRRRCRRRRLGARRLLESARLAHCFVLINESVCHLLFVWHATRRWRPSKKAARKKTLIFGANCGVRVARSTWF